MIIKLETYLNKQECGSRMIDILPTLTVFKMIKGRHCTYIILGWLIFRLGINIKTDKWVPVDID